MSWPTWPTVASAKQAAHGQQTAAAAVSSADASCGSSSHLMQRSTVKLQIAAVFCVTNLAWAAEEGSGKRQQRTRESGIFKALSVLVQSPDKDLFQKAKAAVQQFNNKSLS